MTTFKELVKKGFQVAMENHGFSFDGAGVLFDYLSENDYIGMNTDFDPVGLRCDYSEYNIEDLYYDFPDYVPENCDDEYEKWEKTRDNLRHATTVLEVDDDTVIIASF